MFPSGSGEVKWLRMRFAGTWTGATGVGMTVTSAPLLLITSSLLPSANPNHRMISLSGFLKKTAHQDLGIR